jgi:tetratricopeptide (TPR) repeat protein
VTIDANDVDAAYLLGSALLLAGPPGEGAALLQQAATRDARKAVVAIDLARSLAPPDPADARFVESTVRTHRAEIAIESGDAATAVRSLDRAVAVWPDNYDANNRLAFLLATSADAKLRDPGRAVALAERATAARREYASLATLAAAYASAARFTDAVATAGEARDLAVTANDAAAIAALDQQRALYAQALDGVRAAPRP